MATHYLRESNSERSNWQGDEVCLSAFPYVSRLQSKYTRTQGRYLFQVWCHVQECVGHLLLWICIHLTACLFKNSPVKAQIISRLKILWGRYFLHAHTQHARERKWGGKRLAHPLIIAAHLFILNFTHMLPMHNMIWQVSVAVFSVVKDCIWQVISLKESQRKKCVYIG